MRISHTSPSFVQPNALNPLNPKARQVAALGSQDAAGKTAAVANPGGSTSPARSKHAAASERRPAFVGPRLPANVGTTPTTPRQLDGEGGANDAVSDVQSTTASAHAPAGPVTIEGFDKAWGATQPQYKQYDLDQNGTVDVDDLFKFINSMPGPGGDEPAAPPTLDDIIDAWGQNGGAEDVNGSGRVNIDDIFDFINAMPAPGGDGDVAGAPPKLNDILNAWGQNGGPGDINGSGQVDIDDVFDFINDMPTPPSGGSAVAATEASDAAPVASATKTAAGPMSAAKLHRLTDSLLDHLGTAGFKDQPPTNIRQIIGRLNLPEGQADQVLSRVSARYPNGLGVNYMA